MDAIGLPRILTALLFGLALAQPALAQQGTQPDSTGQAAPQPQKPLPAPSAAAHSVDAMRERYPKGAIDSDEVAEQAQVDVQTVRTLLETQFADSQSACYDRFFTNHCIDKAREARRAGLAVLRPIELEANAFRRQSRVDRRERDMEERRVKAEAEAQERASLQQENEQKAAQRAEERARRERERQSEQAAREGIVDDRVQRHEERLRSLQQEEASKAPERARNVAEFEEKQKKAAERQRKVAERKAQKQAEQAGKAAAPAPAK